MHAQDASDISRRRFLKDSSACALFAPLAGVSIDALIPEEWTGPGFLPAADSADEESYWRLVKKQFFIEEGVNYLNSGTFGPTMRVVYEAASRNLHEMGVNYGRYFRTNYIGEALPQFIGKIAAFTGAKPDEVALTASTTEAMNFIANGLDFRAGDEVLCTSHEHQAGVYPWLLAAKRRGIVVKQLDWPNTPPQSHAEILELFRRAITPRTRVLSFCHIQYTDGTLLPVRELCTLARERGLISVVDGAQTIGMLNFKISDIGCDFYAASFHKWLTCPYGTGMMYVREEMLDRLWPTVVLGHGGWQTTDRYGNPSDSDISFNGNWPKAVKKYSSNIEYYGTLFWPVALAMEFHNLVGRERIERRIRALADHANALLAEIPGLKLHSPQQQHLRAGLISFRAPGPTTPDLFRQLSTERKITMRYVQHPGIGYDVNRLSTHIFNLREDVEAAVSAIREKAKV